MDKVHIVASGFFISGIEEGNAVNSETPIQFVDSINLLRQAVIVVRIAGKSKFSILATADDGTCIRCGHEDGLKLGIFIYVEAKASVAADHFSVLSPVHE